MMLCPSFQAARIVGQDAHAGVELVELFDDVLRERSDGVELRFGANLGGVRFSRYGS
jgi:hypothetical protein